MAAKASDVIRKHKEGVCMDCLLPFTFRGLELTRSYRAAREAEKCKKFLYSGKSCIQLQLRTSLFDKEGENGYFR